MLTVRQLLDYLEGLPEDTPVVIDVRPGDEYVQVDDVTSTNESGPGPRTPMRIELATRRVQRDAIQRELGELRAALCHTLGKFHREPGPQGLTIISVLSDEEIFNEIQRLRTIAESVEEQNSEL
ncbi:hypothetical protein ACFFV7_03935 [Nonomuraea spiralis]|uniref:Uncharacterized protein n=1 Tax=Nonomuraea spiralis TaxID=46182 RepID=A0ABV5I737_9ACTN|nr:hypothetical protein [Nonomuraea spiralis]